MPSINRRLKALFASIAVVAAVVALAAPAMATPVPAKFSPNEQGMRWTGSITIFKAGGSAKTCTFPSFYSSWTASPSYSLYGLVTSYLSCSGGSSLGWAPEGSVSFDTSYSVTINDLLNSWGGHTSPYGIWYGTTTKAPWTNGAGATPSHVTFNKTPIGVTETGEVVTATGTLNAATESGGLLTLTH